MPASDPTRRHFDRGARGYYHANYQQPRNRHAYTLTLRRAACLHMLPATDGPILDLGCGPGAMTIPLLRDGHRVVASDLSLEMVIEAARRARALGVEPCVAVASADRLPFATAAFTAVVTTGVLEYVPELAMAMNEITRVLAPGGSVIATMSLPRRTERLAVRTLATLRGTRSDVKQFIYGRAAFDEIVEAAGLRIDERRCSSFAPFPLDAIWPRSVPWIDAVFGELLNRSELACDHAKTYIVRASKA